ncbi:MAG: ABC transporter substrate-binding protein [Oscillospiraceae bacterium]|nr:ABC transporter substrate-binding protein [Oscillospiraceae bacterium]
MNNPNRAAVKLIVLSLALIMVCVPVMASAAYAPEDFITIRTNSRLECTAAPYVVADKAGFFAEEGVTIEYTGELGSGNTAIAAILSGTNDVFEVHPNQFATYVAEGAPVKAVSLNIVDPPEDADPTTRHMRLYASKTNDAIAALADIADYKPGQKLKINGTVPSCTTFILSSIFTYNGLDASRIEWVTLDSTAAALQALEQGDLDFVFIHPPFYYIADESGYKLIADSFDSGLGPAAGSYLVAFTQEYIESYPENVRRFVNALKKAQAWANEHPVETAQWTAEHIQQEVRANHWYYTGDGIPVSYIQPWIDDLVNSGALDEGQVTVQDLVTFQFEPELP